MPRGRMRERLTPAHLTFSGHACDIQKLNALTRPGGDTVDNGPYRYNGHSQYKNVAIERVHFQFLFKKAKDVAKS